VSIQLVPKPGQATIVLDRDYYPDEYLHKVKTDLRAEGIKVTFTPGKEIENIFLCPSFLLSFVPRNHRSHLEQFLDNTFRSLRLECNSNYVSLHQQFLPTRLNVKTIIQDFVPKFDRLWEDQNARFNVIAGKSLLKAVRSFFRGQFRRNLSDQFLTGELVKQDLPEIQAFIKSAYLA
jgi:hypothetical protein